METYLFCEDILDETISLLQTIITFMGGMGNHGLIGFFTPKVPDVIRDLNVELLKWTMNFDLVERETRKVTIDESLIKSGDYFPVLRLDGLDPMIMYGTGSHSGHTTIALWFEENGVRELYMVES